MNEILQKLYPYSRDQAINDILSFYDQEESVVVNFIYFANIVSHRLFDQTTKTEKLKVLPLGSKISTELTLSPTFCKALEKSMEVKN